MFKVDDDDWTLDLREGKGSVAKGVPADKPDLTLTINDENFAKMVMGKLNPQQVRDCKGVCVFWGVRMGRRARTITRLRRARAAAAAAARVKTHTPTSHTPRHTPKAFLLRKLKISGAMGMALKLQPILDAAAPKAKL